MSRSVHWYAQRLRRMSPEEVVSRVGDRLRQVRWAGRQVHPGNAFPPVAGLLAPRVLASPVPPGARAQVPPESARRVVAAADRLLAGDWEVLGTARPDIVDPDWFRDPVTGRRAPDAALAFGIDHRDEAVTGNVKSVWELSRHHHLTVLAAAWWLTSDTRYADLVAAQLRSWWARNPFLSGIHWTSGIELGVRLTSWVWVRRLLDDWPGVADLFEENPDALAQLHWHQEHLAAFRSRGSSANNHVIAEAVGRLAAACAFPWFAESEGWRRSAARELEQQLGANTFRSGVNRELASDYHRFVTELGLVALVEADAAGHPLDEGTRSLLVRSLDAAAALLDAAGHPPRQGDGDEGRALVLDDPDTDPWAVLLAAGASTLGACDWWPTVGDGVTSTLLGSLSTSAAGVERPASAPRDFPDAGVHLLRTAPGDGPEIWCRCDGGPHGFLSIAAHGHADALSVEVRHDGVELLVDPGTYCYHGEPEWRSYFRSTRAHNTIEVDGADQAVEAGPFMWGTHADAVVDRTEAGPDGVQMWAGHHTAYSRLDAALCHDRQVDLDGPRQRLTVTDTVTGSQPHRLRLFWHLGPDVTADLDDDVADLCWPGRDGEVHHGRLVLPVALDWSAHRGETDPPARLVLTAVRYAASPPRRSSGRARGPGTLDPAHRLVFSPPLTRPRGPFSTNPPAGQTDPPRPGRTPTALLPSPTRGGLVSEQAVDLRSTWAVLRRRSGVLAVAALLGGLVGVGVLYLVAPAFTSTSVRAASRRRPGRFGQDRRLRRRHAGDDRDERGDPLSRRPAVAAGGAEPGRGHRARGRWRPRHRRSSASRPRDRRRPRPRISPPAVAESLVAYLDETNGTLSERQAEAQLQDRLDTLTASLDARERGDQEGHGRIAAEGGTSAAGRADAAALLRPDRGARLDGARHRRR